MKRFTGVRVLTQALMDSDIGVFIGEELGKEACPYIGEGSYLFFSDETEYLLSFVSGMAMCTDKRVFVFCEDQYIVRNLSELMQMAVTKCRNLFLVLFIKGEYSSVPHTPLVFDSVNSKHGVFYNLGFIVHDYKLHFKNSKNPISVIRDIWERTRGPVVVLLETGKGSKPMSDIVLSGSKDLEKTKEFIMDESIKAHIFVPPF